MNNSSPLKKLDIVYFVKDSLYNEELRYSLRSVEENFPHNRVWFVGGKPIHLHPDKQMIVNQRGETKWDKVRDLLRLACLNDEITEDFVLFNDDFFVMESVDDLPYYYDGSLASLIYRVQEKNNRNATGYTKQIAKAITALDDEYALNFELHVPMKINRKKMLEIYEMYPDTPAHRSLYGNKELWGDEEMYDKPDVKIVSLEDSANPYFEDFCSTSDRSFRDGKIGQYIRDSFPNPSRFER